MNQFVNARVFARAGYTLHFAICILLDLLRLSPILLFLREKIENDIIKTFFLNRFDRSRRRSRSRRSHDLWRGSRFRGLYRGGL